MFYCSAPSPPLTRKKNISMKYNINLQGRAVEMQFHKAKATEFLKGAPKDYSLLLIKLPNNHSVFEIVDS